MTDQSDRLALPTAGWRLITDTVMGGVSQGRSWRDTVAGRDAVCLEGDVSTDNNGGFVQITLDLDSDTARRAAQYDGISLQVLGNGERYNLHLRTRDLWLPWQSFRAGFDSAATWHEVRLPFTTFEPYRTGASLRPERLQRIGVVAIGRDFDASVCVAEPAFYRVSS